MGAAASGRRPYRAVSLSILHPPWIMLMLRSRILALTLALPLTLSAQYKPKYTVEQFLSPPFPLVFASAKNADRIAWVSYDRGKRNIYTAAAPTFTPVKLTAFDKDDGQDITAVEVSD